MKYGITKLIINCKPLLEISRQEFDDARLIKRSLVKVLSIEEKLDILLESYIEYEKELYALSLKNVIFSHQDWSTFQNDRRVIDRRLINLLTACRLYVDQVIHDIQSIYGDDIGKGTLVKQRMSQEYNSNFAYRVLETFRNYVQHRGLPIYHLSYSADTEENVSGMNVRHTITPSFSVSKIKEDIKKDKNKFKQAVLKELETLGDLIDLKPLIRQYMESFGRIHLFIRELLANDLTKWDSTILQIQKSFCESFGENTLGLAIVAYDDSGEIVDSEHIFKDLITHRQWLVQKNSMLTRYNSAIISSESRLRDV